MIEVSVIVITVWVLKISAHVNWGQVTMFTNKSQHGKQYTYIA